MANINIGGRLHNTATGNVVAGANEILDDTKGKKQSVINQETDEALAGKQAALVSGTNIKTVNGESILGSGNIQAGDPDAIKYSAQTLTDAQKTQARTNIGAYNKPATGIPATDLASAAQTSLGKADTSYQKPQSGVPKSDLASGVQGSLDLADTAVQAENVGPILPPPETDEFATKTQVTQLEAKVTDLEGTSSDLADAIGLIPHSENLYIDGTTENTQLFTTSDGQGGVTVAYGPTHGFQITSFVFEVIPGKTLSITGKTSGNRFVIATFDHYPVAGDTPLTSQTATGTSASIQLGQTATHLLLYVNTGSSVVDLSSMKVFYGESWIDNPSSLLGEQVETLQGDVESLQGDVTELQEKLNATVFVEYTSADITDFTVGYYLPPSATSFSQDNLSANANMCYKLFEIPETEGFGEFVHAYCGFRDNYNTYENLFFIKANYEVISANGMLLAGKDYTIPENAKYICVCFLKNYTPFGVQVKLPPSIVGEVAEAIEEQVTESVEETVEASITESLNDYLNITRSHQERTARDFCFDQERRNPFEWKAFNKRWFAFMNDDANTNMGDYFNVCRIRRVPYCHAFILNRYNSYSFTGNDANRTNLVKCPAIGQEYSVTKAEDQTYLRLYIDRQYTAGFPIKITVGNDSYTINDAENARISIGSGTSVTFTITEINGVTSGRTNFINIIATADATDSVSSTKTWTVQEMVKNIVFDFGEILAHDTPVINMWDLKEAEDYFAKYIFDDPRKIDELLGEEHCKGAILPGGPNSDRGMNTKLGQHYCCRYLLYADYYGTTPQYMIQRVSYSSVVGATTVNYETAKANALAWLSNRANGFYPLFTHSEKSPEEVGAVIDAVLESSDTICSTWRIAYESNS